MTLLRNHHKKTLIFKLNKYQNQHLDIIHQETLLRMVNQLKLFLNINLHKKILLSLKLKVNMYKNKKINSLIKFKL